MRLTTCFAFQILWCFFAVLNVLCFLEKQKLAFKELEEIAFGDPLSQSTLFDFMLKRLRLESLILCIVMSEFVGILLHSIDFRNLKLILR